MQGVRAIGTRSSRARTGRTTPLASLARTRIAPGERGHNHRVAPRCAIEASESSGQAVPSSVTSPGMPRVVTRTRTRVPNSSAYSPRRKSRPRFRSHESVPTVAAAHRSRHRLRSSSILRNRRSASANVVPLRRVHPRRGTTLRARSTATSRARMTSHTPWRSHTLQTEEKIDAPPVRPGTDRSSCEGWAALTARTDVMSTIVPTGARCTFAGHAAARDRYTADAAIAAPSPACAGLGRRVSPRHHATANRHRRRSERQRRALPASYDARYGKQYAHGTGTVAGGGLHRACIAGRWRLDSMLGRGAFSEVWLARHCITGGMRAIKLLEPRLSMLPDLCSASYASRKLRLGSTTRM